MLRTIAICTVLLFAATVPVRAQTAPAHPATAVHGHAAPAQPSATSGSLRISFRRSRQQKAIARAMLSFGLILAAQKRIT
jgi:hypothetical protein